MMIFKPTRAQALNTNLQAFLNSGLMSYAYTKAKNVTVDVSFGMNPLGCSPKVKTRIEQLSSALDPASYPPVLADDLCMAIADYHAVAPENILVEAGTAALLHLCLLSFVNPGEMVLMPQTSFPEFQLITLLVNAQPAFMPMDAQFNLEYEKASAMISRRVSVVILCNPNNPTGGVLNISQTRAMIEAHPEQIFIIDEANIDFGGESMIPAIRELQNVIILRSFSKGFGLANFRIGYALAHENLIYPLRRRQTPFCTSGIAQKAALIALEDREFLTQSKAFCDRQREFLLTELAKINFELFPTESNFILAKLSPDHPPPPEFYNRLKSNGCLVVPGSSFNRLDDSYFRISPRDEQTNINFIDNLSKIFF